MEISSREVDGQKRVLVCSSIVERRDILYTSSHRNTENFAKRTFPPRNIALASLHHVAGPFNYAATNWQFIHRHRDAITYAVSLSVGHYMSLCKYQFFHRKFTHELPCLTCALPVLLIIKQFIRPTLSSRTRLNCL